MILNKLLILMAGGAMLCGANSPDDGKPRWYGNDHFKITQNEGVISVAMSKMPWESFSVDMEDIRSAEGVVSFEVKSDVPITLRADGFTRDNTQIELFNETISPDNYQQVYYKFTNRDADISHILFYANPGKEFNGCLLFKNVRTASVSESNALQSFPNPTTGEFSVQLPDDKFTQISIYDVAGNLVLTRESSGATMKFNLANQRHGVYIIKARSTTAVLTSKITVE